MSLSYSHPLLSVLYTDIWSPGILIGVGLLVGLLLGFWLGTYLTISRNPEKQSLAEDFIPYHARKPTLDPAERRAREQKDLL